MLNYKTQAISKNETPTLEGLKQYYLVEENDKEIEYLILCKEMASLEEIIEGEKATRAKIKLIAYKYEYILDEELNIIDQKDGSSEESTSHGNKMEELGIKEIDGITYTQYGIWNKAQLEDFRDRVNDGEDFVDCLIEQKANINLNLQNWIPIGDVNVGVFSGRYDGNNHTISGLNINNASDVQGLFGMVSGYSETKKAIIENLTVEGNVVGSSRVGGIAGAGNYITIENCTNKVNVTSTYIHGTEAYTGNLSDTGGIVGRIGVYGGNIINCKNYGTITAEYGGVGGIVGWHRKGSIIGCENHAEIINSNVPVIGGIVGWIEEGKVEKCYNSKKIEGTSEIGGICGSIGYSYNGTIKLVNILKVNNIGEIIGTRVVGGITGSIVAKSSIEQASNKGYVHSTGVGVNNFSYTGGIMGRAVATGGAIPISYCYNTGNIESICRGIGGITGSYERWKHLYK